MSEEKRREIAETIRDLADEALCRRDVAAALPLYRESLERWRQLGEKLHVAGSLLGPATVALAIPLYRQLDKVRRSTASVLISITAGSLTAAGSAVASRSGSTPSTCGSR